MSKVSGLPIVDALVSLESTSGSVNAAARTGADGRFVLTHLRAGTYALVARADGFVAVDGVPLRPRGGGVPVVVREGERVDVSDLALESAGAIEVQLVDEFGDPAPGVVIRAMSRIGSRFGPLLNPARDAMSTTQTDDRGWWRVSRLLPGEYVLVAVPEPFERSGPASFAVSYYPGTSNIDGAAAVRVEAGQQVGPVRLNIVPAASAAVFGTVVATSGQPVPKARVTLMPARGSDAMVAVIATATAGPDGGFFFLGVPEGAYVLQAVGPRSLGTGPLVVSPPSGVERVQVTVRPFSTARGRVLFEGSATPPSGAERVRLTFQPTEPTHGLAILPRVHEDWQFEIADLSGRGLIRASGPEGWRLSRVRLGGRDITNDPYDFGAGDVSGLEVVLSSRVGRLSGVVQHAGRAAAKATVAIFGADDVISNWPGVRFARFESNERGEFDAPSLLEGRYVAVALAESASVDAATLAALRPRMTEFAIREGAETRLTLVLVK